MEKTLTDKDEIIRQAKDYLKENSLIDLTGFVKDNCPETHTHSAFVRDIAYKMRKSGEFEITEKENGQRFYVFEIPKKSWRELNPLLHDIILAVLTAILSLLVGWVLLTLSNKDQEKRDANQDQRIINQSDSIELLEKRTRTIEDSLRVFSNELDKGRNDNKTKKIP